MTELNAEWKPLRAAFARLRDNGRRAQFWLRDDDAIEPTPALERLLSMCEGAGVPVVLAVIPQPTGVALAERLKNSTNVSVAVHGWAHHNHAGPDEKKQELGPHRPVDLMRTELAAGLAKLKALHGDRAINMLVPPWNRIDPELVEALGGVGFDALSTFGPSKPSPIHLVNSNVDLIDWHGTGVCFEHANLVDLIVGRLEGDDPVGVMGHHLVHDEQAWLFLERLFALTNEFDVEWISGRQLVKAQ